MEKKYKEVRLIQITEFMYDKNTFSHYNDKILQPSFGYNAKDLPDLIFYRYADGGYDGQGDALYFRDGRWEYADLSHCSCFEAEDEMLHNSTKYKHPKELLREKSKEIFDFVEICLWVGYEIGIFGDKPDSLVKPWIGKYNDYTEQIEVYEYE